MGTLLDWFKTRREATIIKKTRDHAKKVYDCNFELNNLVSLLLQGKEKEAPKLIKRINEIENECDDIRRNIMIDLTKGELSPSVREDLAHLVKRLDSVANNANATAKRLGLLTYDVLAPIADEIKKMSQITLDCVKLLQNTIDLQMGHAVDKVIESVNEINRLEHEVDVLNYAVKQKLITIRPEYSPYTAILLFEMVNLLENISDNAEDTADFIKMINVRQ